ncbi:tRNA (adenosine(37)-N6)-dimethylallyltransferase MiaA [Arthrobacter sp. NEB 688]|uniref:tRNA (adenosine(37)-N6)-dimethylallyltransferase MiaA n=1 Tax=Arthrobacter sp. NEB 688 TaxID=904039 RepID=UPI001563E9FE|nr:tRNA (adenosine(37)-N6)-dimethylallyltransferase MiaA [Arthrobacter sp. NEB 688]QKE86131.1 tRNA (adenosine(37)-N6)-dimethylallyltransferase MiaA [Arthrobacter sp. NEB 688]
MSTPPLVVAVVGATATGKSGLGVALAHRLGGEVVSADASQLYRGMDVGTAKLTLAEREGVAHHQLDVLDVTQEASVAAYQREARVDLEAALGRGRVPLLVGGSGLYVRAALDRLEIPPTDATVRADLEARAAAEGTPALYAELAALDPAAAAAIEPNNTRRVVRALEVVRLTGRPFSATMPTREHLRPTLVLGLRLPREELDERIGRRTRAMFDGGLVEETRELVEHGLREGRTASRAVGYAQALAVLDGTATVEEAVDDTALRTRRLVRRQESWFGADPRIHWLDAADPGLLEEALAVVERAQGPGAGPGCDDGPHG